VLPGDNLQQSSPIPDTAQTDKERPTDSAGKAGLPRVVVVGSGFGGLNLVRGLSRGEVEVILLDRNNYHGFWPLLYQVATAELIPDSIAFPIREVVRKYHQVTFHMAEVCDVDLQQKQIQLQAGPPLAYDYLVLAAGSTNNYFGNETTARNTFSLKDVDQAVEIRHGLLKAFEKASLEPDLNRRKKLLTFLIIGSGPTGVELSAAFAELILPLVRKYYPALADVPPRIILVEAHTTMLESFPKGLQKKAQQHLERLGVEVLKNHEVTQVENGEITFKHGSKMQAGTVVWAAGVRASPLAEKLGIKLAHGDRVPVEPTLNLQDHPDVFVIGDMAYLEGYKGGQQSYPGVAQVAIQMGERAAKNILAQVEGRPMKKFHYLDKGQLSTIGRKDAVADIFNLQLSGLLAWLVWAAVHIYYLLGMRNRLLVMLGWAYNYLTYNLAMRIIGGASNRKENQ
jgi:NADH:ubiquinone reductase (H+-translocating)